MGEKRERERERERVGRKRERGAREREWRGSVVIERDENRVREKGVRVE